MKSFMTNRSKLRRKVLVGTTLLALGGFLAASAASCVTLPDINENQCGNSVVEPENGEACDEETERCGLPSSIGACRFLCDYQTAGGIECPTGLGCGLDGICRKSDGLSDSPISIAGGGIQKLMSGDFDGDGRQDVVAVGFSTADVHFLTTEGYIERTVTLPNERGFPGVGDINGDELSDIVLALDRSVGVLLGQEDRSFAPQSYTTMFVAPKTHKMIPIGAYSADGAILSFSESKSGDTSVEFITLNEEGGHIRLPAGPAPVPGTLIGAVATKSVIVGNEICGVAAFELSARGVLPARVVYGQRCGIGDLSYVDIPFPQGYSPWGGAYFADADKDGFEYLFLGLSNGIPSLKMILSDSTGQEFPLPDLGFEAGNCDPANPRLASAPLAVGDINGDSYPDVIDNRGILLYTPYAGTRFTRVCHSYSYSDPADKEKILVAWTNAVIGDFNGDGLDDVMASRVNEGVIDLWTSGPGGFNTIPIFVGGRVSELVAGDFDGDAISDVAFRFAPPTGADPMMMTMAPTPLFAMFGNPLALPSPPQPLGMLKGMQHIAAGRIKGANWAGQPDVISDLVVLSASDDPGDDMPITLFQGNVTRNLTAPLSLQEATKTASSVLSTDRVFGIFISKFGASACNRFKDPMDPTTDSTATPSNIIALGDSGRIWLAGCAADGSSLPAQKNLNLQDVSFLFAPVDRTSGNDALAVFMSNPPFKDGDMSPPPSLGLGLIEYQGGKEFSKLPELLDKIDFNTQLPKVTNVDVPYAFADLDDNGLRDVIVTGKTGVQRKIYVFWNGDATNTSGKLEANTMTAFDFTPLATPNGPGMPPSDETDNDIKDIVGINFDGDHFQELAILTNNHVYIAKLTLAEVKKENEEEEEEEKDAPLELETGRPLGLLFGNSAFADIRGGQAILAIDANSDGIDDLIVAESGKLLLFIGTERLK
jgi:hypothetical protein